ncbi:hypothetical protein [Anaplasma marginale]|uniref:hypothetical protein n=1 Tax=Anaplasma marginale TaxID=770 RepID=UPI0023EE2DA0|nr:hypothetical protein [Anaplasma marginale]
MATALGKMTKGEAHKWGKAVESATGTTNGQTVSQNVCGKGTTSGSNTNQCGVNATNGSSTTQHKISEVFTEGTEAESCAATNLEGNTS